MRRQKSRPDKFHGVGPFEVRTGEVNEPKKKDTYTDVFGKVLCDAASDNKRITAITAAMADGTGLKRFARMFPDRFFDVGIAEGHGVTFAAGLAAGGMKPVFAVYSSFLQRGYDQIIHDVALQNLPVVFAVDPGRTGWKRRGDPPGNLRSVLPVHDSEYDGDGSEE